MSTTLLLATVGGATEPVVASLLHWHPARVIFIVTPQTRDSITRDILPKVHDAGWTDFDAGRYDLHVLPDAQDYTGIVHHLVGLDEHVAAWLRGQPSVGVVVDFTGGTKAMSAALALAAGRWPCQLSYVGGSERTKDGVGIVVSGREQIIHSQNPADALGLVALDTACALLRTHAFAAAHTVLQQALRCVTDPARKAELSSVANFADALADWDRFQHSTALNKLRDLPRHTHNLDAALGRDCAQAVLAAVSKLQTHLQVITDARPGTPSRALILDLLANARRRLEEHRWDDATARLYRALEATAQLHLAERGFSDTAAVPLNQIPEPLSAELSPHAESGIVKLGVQHAWRLLQLLDPSAAEAFFTAGLADPRKSALSSRNLSILAHGFGPVGEQTARTLFQNALVVLGAVEADLPATPSVALNLS